MRRSSSKLRPRAVYGALLAFCLVLSPGRAGADDSPLELVSKGLELRRARQDARALTLFRTAYAASPLPMILGQIALAEQALGRWPAAEQDLVSALATHDGWVEAHRSALETALSVIQSHLCSLSVTSNLEAAELWLDEEDLGGLSPTPVRVVAGRHELSLRAADGRVVTRSVELVVGQREHFHLELPTSPVIANPAPVAPPTRLPGPRPLLASTHPASPSAGHPQSARRALAYGSAALAVVALGEAITASLLRLHYAHRYNSDDCAPDRSVRCAPYRDIADTWGEVAVVGYVVAGAAGLGSVALFSSPYWLPRPSVVGGQAGLTLSGTF